MPARAQGLEFKESYPLTEITGPSGITFLPLIDRDEAPDGLFCYVPPEVARPEYGNGAPHPAQKLSCFLPTTPAPDEKFPVLVWATTGAFLSIPPAPPQLGLLDEALRRGWAVISVGTVGIDSTPVYSGASPQPDRCLDTNNVQPCWDYNLWYEPDEDPSSPWNDFNYFYGEKDLVWARQYIAEKANILCIDNERVVLCGTSTGANYSTFVAFASEPWKDSTFPGRPGLMPQAKRDTQVAGVILLEPVGWLEGLSPQGFPFAIGGFHWPMETVPTQRAQWASGVFPREVLRSDSPSRWIRGSTRRVPVFIACGDGDDVSTFFGRDGNLPVNQFDYDRDPMSSPPNDPAFTFPTDPIDEAALNIHDAWQAWNLRKDLDLADPVFHNRYSRLYMRQDLNWDFFPASMTTNLMVLPSPLTDASKVPLLEEVHPALCFDPPSLLCASLANADLGPRIVDWMSCVFDALGEGVACANVEPNYDVLRASSAILGQDLLLQVDLDAAGLPIDGYDHQVSLGFLDLLADGSTWTKLPLAFAGGTSLLCFDADGSALDPFPAVEKDPVTGIATTVIPVPNQHSLLDMAISVQAVVVDLCASGTSGAGCVPPASGEKLGLRLTNALDIAFLPGP